MSYSICMLLDDRFMFLFSIAGHLAVDVELIGMAGNTESLTDDAFVAKTSNRCRQIRQNV